MDNNPYPRQPSGPDDPGGPGGSGPAQTAAQGGHPGYSSYGMAPGPQRGDDAAPPPKPPKDPGEGAAVRRRHGRGGVLSRVILAFVALLLVVALCLVAFSITQLSRTVGGLFTTVGYDNTPPAGSFAVIRVVGTIQQSGSNALGINEPSYHHSATVSYIKQLADSEDNAGILLYLNTSGGGVLESDEMYLALKRYKEATGRPVWAFMYATCASGGYYISAAADHIVAERNTTTGSIGVYIAMTDSSVLYEKIGIETVLIRSGAQKGAGMAGLPISDEQRAVYQSMVDEMYGQFVEVVVEGRGMDEARVRQLADGRVFSARQALENGLIDALGEWDAVLEEFALLTGATASYPNFSRSSTVGNLLSAYMAATPQNETETQLALADKYPPGVPMALYDPALT